MVRKFETKTFSTYKFSIAEKFKTDAFQKKEFSIFGQFSLEKNNSFLKKLNSGRNKKK